MSIVRITIVSCLAVLLGWRVVATGMGMNAARQPELADQARAINWHAGVAEGHLAKGLLASDPAQAEASIKAAISANPMLAKAWLALANQREAAGDAAGASRWFATAAKLDPFDANIALQTGLSAAKRGDITATVAEFSRAMSLERSLEKEIFPIFNQLVASPEGRAAFKSLLSSAKPPPWWGDFFGFLKSRVDQAEALAELIRFRETSPAGISIAERETLVGRLLADGRWIDGYFIWLNGQSAERLNQVGLVNNGSFEVSLDNSSFDWQIVANEGAFIEPAPTYGTVGEKALRVALQGNLSKPLLLTQSLLLKPGKYQLSGLVRLESVRAGDGLQWRLACKSSSGAPLALTDRGVGTDQWRRFNHSFEVPATDCAAQTLALTLKINAKADLQASGIAWYDDLGIIAQAKL